MMKKVLSSLLMGSLLVTSSYIVSCSKVEAAMITSIPNTIKVEKSYDTSFLSVPGFASLGVNDRSSYVGTSYYRTVSNGREFLQAILDASKGTVKVVEVMDSINLGWTELALDSTEKSKYSFITNYPKPSNGFTNPLLIASGVTKLSISNVDGLTIFSTSGKTLNAK